MLFLSASIHIALSAALAVHAGLYARGMAIAKNPLFSPAPAAHFAPQAAALRQYVQTPAGKTALSALTVDEQRAVGLLLDLKEDNEAQLRAASPILQSLDAQALGQKISGLAQAAEPASELKAIAENLIATGREPVLNEKVAAAGREALAEFKALADDNTISGDDQETWGRWYFNLTQAMNRAGAYGKYLSKDQMGELRRTLDAVETRNTVARMEELYETGAAAHELTGDDVTPFDFSATDREPLWRLQAKPAVRPDVSVTRLPGAGGDAGGVILPQSAEPLAAKSKGPTIVVPQFKGIKYGSELFAYVDFPVRTTGERSDIEAQLVKVWAQSDRIDRASYEYKKLHRDFEAAKEAIKAGKPVRWVADASQSMPHLFPKRDGKDVAAREASQEYQELMELYLAQKPASKRPEKLPFQLRITKGLGTGILHAKYTIGYLMKAAQEALVQAGSANYTWATLGEWVDGQLKDTRHWENVIYMSDARRRAFYAADFERLFKTAAPYREDLTLADIEPNVTENPPPVDEDPSLIFGDAKFPVASASPGTDTPARWKQVMGLSDEYWEAFFGYYPTPEIGAATLALIKRAAEFYGTYDVGQAHNRYSKPAILLLQKNGAKPHLRSGPGEPHWPPENGHDIVQKMHKKSFYAKNKRPGVKGTEIVGVGSTNKSQTAFNKSHEITAYFTEPQYVEPVKTEIQGLYEGGFEPDFSHVIRTNDGRPLDDLN